MSQALPQDSSDLPTYHFAYATQLQRTLVGTRRGGVNSTRCETTTISCQLGVASALAGAAAVTGPNTATRESSKPANFIVLIRRYFARLPFSAIFVPKNPPRTSNNASENLSGGTLPNQTNTGSAATSQSIAIRVADLSISIN